MTGFILANTMLGFASLLLGRRFRPTGGAEHALIGLVLYTFLVIVIGEVLGLAGALEFRNALILSGAILALSAALCGRSLCRIGVDAQTLNGYLAGAYQNPGLIAVFSILAGFLSVFFYKNLINPPFGWDGLTSHLAFPAYWLEQRRLINPVVVFGEPAIAYYPINSELFYLWLIMPFKSAYLADAGQILFLAIAMLAIYLILTQEGLPKQIGFLAAIVFAMTPDLFRQAHEPMNDVMIAAFFLSAVYFFLKLTRAFSSRGVFIFGITLGIFLGIKTSSVIYAGMLTAVFAATLLAKRQFRELAVSIGIISATLIVAGGYQYLKNFIDTGNPLYPAKIFIFGKEVLKGVTTYAPPSGEEGGLISDINILFFHERLGAQFAILWPAGIIAAFLAHVRWCGRSKPLFWLNLIAIAYFLLFFFVIPYRCPRYAHPIIGLGVIIFYRAAWLWVRRRDVWTVFSLVVMAVSIFDITKRGELLTCLGVSLAIAVLVMLGKKAEKLFSMRNGLLAVALFLCVVAVLEPNYIAHSYERYINAYPWEQERIEGWKWINHHVAGKRIAYTGTCAPFPLYGAKLTNAVEYVPVNDGGLYIHDYSPGSYMFDGDLDAFFGSFENPGNYRENPDKLTWLENLKEYRIDYLFISDLHASGRFPIEDNWAGAEPDIFEPVFSNRRVRIYRIEGKSPR